MGVQKMISLEWIITLITMRENDVQLNVSLTSKLSWAVRALVFGLVDIGDVSSQVFLTFE